MANPLKLIGTVTVRAGGQVLATAADAEVTVKLGGVEREAVPCSDDVVRYREKKIEASIEAPVQLITGMTMAELQAQEGATVTVEADNGYTATMADAVCAGGLELGSGGTVKVKWFGSKIEETAGG